MKRDAKIPTEFTVEGITKFNDDDVCAGDRVVIIYFYNDNKNVDVKLNGKIIKKVSMENIREAYYLLYKDYE